MTDMYNNKSRQAEGPQKREAGRRRAAFKRRRERPMQTMNVFNDILGLYIILVLVLVVLPPKQNSAFGHARNKGAVNGFLR